MLILFLSRLTLFGAMSGMEKWWRSHKNFALKYRFVSVFRLCSVFIYCCSLVLIKSAFAYIKVLQWENARERGREVDKSNALVWWRVDFITCNVQTCFRMFCYRFLVNFDSVHAFRFIFAICVSVSTEWMPTTNLYIEKLNQKWIPL